MQSVFHAELDELPDWIRTALRHRWRYSLETSIASDVQLKYRLGRWHSVAWSNQLVVRREMLGWLEKGDQRIGAIAVSAYDVRRCYDNAEMIEVMDAEYAEEYELAYALASGWEDVRSDVCCYGPILYFKAALIERRHRGSELLAQTVNKIVWEVFPKFSIAVVRAPYHPDRNGGREAAMRYYATMGARAFPGRAGSEGWMWAPNPKSPWIEGPKIFPVVQ